VCAASSACKCTSVRRARTGAQAHLAGAYHTGNKLNNKRQTHSNKGASIQPREQEAPQNTMRNKRERARAREQLTYKHTFLMVASSALAHSLARPLARTPHVSCKRLAQAHLQERRTYRKAKRRRKIRAHTNKTKYTKVNNYMKKGEQSDTHCTLHTAQSLWLAHTHTHRGAFIQRVLSLKKGANSHTHTQSAL